MLSKREQINEVLRVKLDEVTERWGGKVTTVEIREITPPRDVQDAMNRQLSAERTRRAVITESEGTRQAAINVAEGQKQSEILKAEGDRQAAILRAEGFSEALTRIYGAASGVDQKTMALQYLEALKAIGASPSTKFVIPAEFTRLAESAARYVEQGMNPGRPPGPRRGGAAGGGAAAERTGTVGGPRIGSGGFRPVMARAASRILDAPRFGPDEQGLKPDLDALGGEVVRLRARDGLRLHARWLPSVDAGVGRLASRRHRRRRRWSRTRTRRSSCSTAGRARSRRTSSRSARSLRRTAGRARPRLPRPRRLRRRPDHVRAARDRGRRRRPGLARRAGHPAGRAQSAPRWAGSVAIDAVVALGDGSLTAADHDPFGPAATVAAPRPRIVGVVAEAGPAGPPVPIANRMPWRIGGPLRRFARRADVRLGRRPRSAATCGRWSRAGSSPSSSPSRCCSIHGGADRTVPPKEGRRLAALAGPHAEHWIVPGAGHGTARAADPAGWDDRVGRFLRQAFSQARDAGL